MKNRPLISDVMTREPLTAYLGQPISEVYELLEAVDFHHVPVVDGDRIAGIISHTDILKLVYDVEGTDDRMLRTFLDHQFTLEDAMSTNVVTVKEDDRLRTAADHLSGGAIHSVLVVDDDQTLVGIITSTDLIRVLVDLL